MSAVRSSVQLRARPRGPPSTRMVPFILCLLPALLATTNAQAATLTCNTCFGQTETCNFASGTCQDNKATGGCLSVAETIKLGGTQNTNFYKQCLSNYKSDIEVPISFTVGNGNYVRINTTRCDTDNCNSAVPGVPKGSTTVNGLQCPTCFALNFTLCNSSVTPCTGDETYCMDFTGFLHKSSSFSPFQAKGCTTASPQVIKPGAILTTSQYTFDFFWGACVLAEKIPTNPPSTTSASLETTSPTPNKTTTTPLATTTTTTTPNATITTPETTTTTTIPAATDTTTNTTTTIPETTTTTSTPATTDSTPNTTTTTSATTDTTTNITTATIPNITTPLNATTTSPTTTTIPDTNTTNKTTTIPKTTPTPTTIITNKPTAPPKSHTTNKPTASTTSGGSPSLGRFSFALYLPGLLLVKLLS